MCKTGERKLFWLKSVEKAESLYPPNTHTHRYTHTDTHTHHTHTHIHTHTSPPSLWFHPTAVAASPLPMGVLELTASPVRLTTLILR